MPALVGNVASAGPLRCLTARAGSLHGASDVAPGAAQRRMQMKALVAGHAFASMPDAAHAFPDDDQRSLNLCQQGATTR
jgi:hypothetical protein